MEHGFVIPSSWNNRCDAFFAAIGKALAVATLFEASCRSLHLSVVLRDILSQAADDGMSKLPPILESRSAIKTYLNAQGKKLASHVSLVRQYLDHKHLEIDILSQITDVLDKARIARNDIAHRASLNFNEWYVDQESMDRAILFLRERVETVVLALQLLSMMLPLLSPIPNSPPPPREEFDAIPATYQAWVFAGLARADKNAQ